MPAERQYPSLMDRRWMLRAVCTEHDPTAFFDVTISDVPKLRTICDSCPVVNLCRPYAIIHEEYGFWGGLTEIERKQIRNQDQKIDQIALEQTQLGLVEPHHLLSRSAYREYVAWSQPLAERLSPPSPEEMTRLLDFLAEDLEADLPSFQSPLSQEKSA